MTITIYTWLDSFGQWHAKVSGGAMSNGQRRSLARVAIQAEIDLRKADGDTYCARVHEHRTADEFIEV